PGSIQAQRVTPARQTRLPRPIPQTQPNVLLTSGVTTGASTPPALPPVLKIPAAVAPRRPPNSSAVAHIGPSVAPTAASASANQRTIQPGWVARRPAPRRAAPLSIPPTTTAARPRRRPQASAR